MTKAKQNKTTKVKRTEVREKVVTKKVKEVVLTFEGKVLNRAEEGYLAELEMLKSGIMETDDIKIRNAYSDRAAQIVANLRLVRSL